MEESDADDGGAGGRNSAEMEKLLARVRLLERQIASCLLNNRKTMGKFRSLEEQIGDIDGRLEEVEMELWPRKDKGAEGVEIDLPSTNLADKEDFQESGDASDFEYGEVLGAAVDLEVMDELETKPYECAFCPGGSGTARVLFDNAEGLTNHYNTHHTSETSATAPIGNEYSLPGDPFTCPKCHKKFADHHSMKRHLRTIHSAPRFQCEECGRPFKRKDNLKKHQTKGCHGTVNPQPAPGAPGAVYEGPKLPQPHPPDKQPKTEKSHRWGRYRAGPVANRTCPYCERVFTRREHMRRHIASSHLAPQFSCESCGRPFARKDHLNEHRERVHGTQRPLAPPPQPREPPKPKRRSLCPPQIMDGDEEKHPNPEARRTCPICAKVFQNRTHMVRHQMSIHSEPKYACEFCGKMFRRKDSVRDHLRKWHGQSFGSVRAPKRKKVPEEVQGEAEAADGSVAVGEEVEGDEAPGEGGFMDLELTGI